MIRARMSRDHTIARHQGAPSLALAIGRACGSLALLLAPSALTGEATSQHWTALQRLERPHLEAVHEARLRFARERRELPNQGVYEDFRAVMHVHAEDADHTKGTRAELLAAARKAGVRVVLSTDHRGPKPDSWRGMHEGVLYIAGSEVGDGTLQYPHYGPDGTPLKEGGLRFLSHIEERYDAATEGLAGMEIVNRHTDAVLDKGLYLYLLAAVSDPAKWRQTVENFRAFPDELFAAGLDYRAEIFAKWDRELAQKPFTGIGANDAHQNQIFQGVTFDPYEVSFRNLSTHILARELTEPAIRAALRAGHAYVAHDFLCDPTGFAFAAVNNLGAFPMGDAAPLLGTTRLMAITPLAAKLKLIRHGAVVHETLGTNLTFEAHETGAYRLEAWLTVDGEDRPWIYANPVHLRAPTPNDVKLPSGEIGSNVEARKDIVYVEGPEDEANKHKLDLYVPKGKTNAPVFFFVHGGAWRFGDRSQYPAVGNRYANAGILTVVPSYRLAPRYPHPAQIEDVAAAFAWTVRHIGEYGGDTNRIYVGGHSAGGHLAALLTLDPRLLKAHSLSPQIIRGTLALSGVYNLTVGESQASVFGKDPQRRRDASPLTHIRSGAPPFIITYCEWDYYTLPAQAREFHAALRQANIAADLVYITGENHISEMTNVTREDDPTVAAVVKFIH
jgi:acetyl esterase/lipase